MVTHVQNVERECMHICVCVFVCVCVCVCVGGGGGGGGGGSAWKKRCTRYVKQDMKLGIVPLCSS